MRFLSLLALGLAAGAAGCALEREGTGNVLASGGAAGAGIGGSAGVATGGTGATPVVDASTGGTTPIDDAGNDAIVVPDATPEASACNTPPGACVGGVPVGWEVVAFAVDPAGGCPAGFFQTNKKTNPMVAPGGCDCGCTITTPPCVNGSTTTYYSYTSGGNCGTQGGPLNVSGTGCHSLGGSYQLNNYYKSAPLPVGGACTGNVLFDATKFTTQIGVLCQPPSGCQEEVCAGQVAAGFASCIQTAGDVACPGAPFVNKTLVMDAAIPTCSACDGCSVKAQCNNPRVTFYSDGACSNVVHNVASNGQCVSVQGSGTIVAFKYQVDVANAACTATGKKEASITPTAPVTVCCR